MRFRSVPVLAALSAAGLMASLVSSTTANAADTGVLGSADVVQNSDGVVWAGHCAYEFAAAGVNGGGATFVVEGVGGAVGAAVRDTKVVCTVVKNGIPHTFASQFITGAAAAAAGTFTSNSLAAGTTCAQVFAFLSNGDTVHSDKRC